MSNKKLAGTTSPVPSPSSPSANMFRTSILRPQCPAPEVPCQPEGAAAAASLGNDSVTVLFPLVSPTDGRNPIIVSCPICGRRFYSHSSTSQQHWIDLQRCFLAHCAAVPPDPPPRLEQLADDEHKFAHLDHHLLVTMDSELPASHQSLCYEDGTMDSSDGEPEKEARIDLATADVIDLMSSTDDDDDDNSKIVVGSSGDDDVECVSATIKRRRIQLSPSPPPQPPRRVVPPRRAVPQPCRSYQFPNGSRATAAPSVVVLGSSSDEDNGFGF
ncbi:hypothetical protein BC828DRAFT_389043 [Blastocladiella britannica]|nr:hypothetical protein BC828DRAFT_389043 [Blastocladiella britannica]